MDNIYIHATTDQKNHQSFQTHQLKNSLQVQRHHCSTPKTSQQLNPPHPLRQNWYLLTNLLHMSASLCGSNHPEPQVPLPRAYKIHQKFSIWIHLSLCSLHSSLHFPFWFRSSIIFFLTTLPPRQCNISNLLRYTHLRRQVS